MMELILVRHGETDSNKNRTYLGWTDVELNEEGIKQAMVAAQKLKNEKIDTIFSSPLKRAAKTAELIHVYHSCGITYSDQLKERNFGAWDDLCHQEILERFPDEYELWTKDWKNFCMTGGESSVQAYNRIVSFIEGLIESKQAGTYAIVTHLGCIRKLLGHLLGMGMDGSWRFRVDNATITRVTVNDEKYAFLTLLNG